MATLNTRLADSLPQGITVRAYHLSTPPTKHSPIFSAAPGQPEEITFCESHFLGIATVFDTNREIFVFAIEILIFTTPALTTIFISKADSTGYSPLTTSNPTNPTNHHHPHHPSITKPIIHTFLTFLLQPRLPSPRVVLSLFARSQDQYLFAGSVENPQKHVLDDRQLIRWWCRILDGVWRPYENEFIRGADADADSAAAKQRYVGAHLLVPGTERGEYRAFFPPGASSSLSRSADDVVDGKSLGGWSNDYPVKLLAGGDGNEEGQLPPRCVIPRLPDDPKARFANDLDSDYVGADGHWRSVKTLEQFWEFMSYRQECSSGRLVGFIWIAFVRPEAAQRDAVQDANVSAEQGVRGQALPTPADSQQRMPVDGEQQQQQQQSVVELEEIVVPQSPPASSPPSGEHSVAAETTTAPVTATATSEKSSLETSQPPKASRPINVQWPTTTRGQIVCDQDTYDELTETLLQLDFAGQDNAAESTLRWTAVVREKTGSQEFGVTILGKAAVLGKGEAAAGTASASAAAVIAGGGGKGEGLAPQPTMLTMGVRKKRKPSESEGRDQDRISQERGGPVSDGADGVVAGRANVLGAGLVRKKPKT